MYGRALDDQFRQSVMTASYLTEALTCAERAAGDTLRRAAATPAEMRLRPERLLANAANARRRARQAPSGSYVEAMAITERRCWLILARQQLKALREA